MWLMNTLYLLMNHAMKSHLLIVFSLFDYSDNMQAFCETYMSEFAWPECFAQSSIA